MEADARARQVNSQRADLQSAQASRRGSRTIQTLAWHMMTGSWDAPTFAALRRRLADGHGEPGLGMPILGVSPARTPSRPRILPPNLRDALSLIN